MPSTQPCHCHWQQSGVTAPSRLFLAQRRNYVSEDKYSSITVPHLLSACLHLWGGLPARSHVPPMHRKWPHSQALSSLSLLLHLTHHHLFAACFIWHLVTKSLPFVQNFCHTSESCLALLSELLTVFRRLVCLDRTFLASVLVFPFPCFFSVPQPGVVPLEQHEHREPGSNLPWSLSLPMDGFLCLGLPLLPSHISTSTVPVCWRPVIHTQLLFTYWQNRVGGTLKKR